MQQQPIACGRTDCAGTSETFLANYLTVAANKITDGTWATEILLMNARYETRGIA
jgi:hypothetical protein